LKAVFIVSLAAALLVTPSWAQSFNPFKPSKSFEQAVSRLTDASNRAVHRLEAGFNSVEKRHSTCERRADGSGAAYVDCFVVRPIANSDAGVAVRSWGDALRLRLSAL
jgi:hypothetical protein